MNWIVRLYTSMVALLITVPDVIVDDYGLCMKFFQVQSQESFPVSLPNVLISLQVGIHQCTTVECNEQSLQKLSPSKISYSLLDVLSHRLHNSKSFRCIRLCVCPIQIRTIYPLSPHVQPASMLKMSRMMKHRVVAMQRAHV